MIAERMKRIELSPTLKINAQAKAMKSAGIDVVDLSVGEPDFPTPDNIKQAAQRALDDNFTHYTQNDGIPELKQAIIEMMQRDHRITYKPGEILVSCGAKHSLYNLAIALLNRDDEVIVPAPYWVSYTQQILLAKGKPVIVQTREEDGFKLTPQLFRDNISFRTKAVMINNPCNPTGTGYRRDELKELAAIAVENGIYLIADEIYEKIIYDDFEFVSIASLGEEIKSRTIVINGVSKAYSMTGWRIGFAAGPKDVISAMNTIQSHNTSNPNSIAQRACVEAFRGPQNSVRQMRAEFEKRRNFMQQCLRRIPGLSCYEPQGAFYLFPNIRFAFEKEYRGMVVRNSFGLAYYLLKEAHVAVVPGEAFGADDYIRLSYASSMPLLEKGMSRIEEAFSKLRVSQRKRKVLFNNVKTNVRHRLPVHSEVTSADRDGLVAEIEAFMPSDQYYEWNANINGIIVQLRTNSAHMHDFWVENWYPAQIESDIEPHGIIYAVENLPGREPACYYHSDSKTGLVINTGYYGQARQLAVGIVADLGERLYNVHTVRGRCLDRNGKGTLLMNINSPAAGSCFHALMTSEGTNLHSEDVVFVRYRDRAAIADISERKYYLRTDISRYVPAFSELLDRCKCENVVTKRTDCTTPDCTLEPCALEQGEPFCYFAYKKSRAMVDPVWIAGSDRYVKRTSLERLIFLTHDPHGSAMQDLSFDAVLDILERGIGDLTTARGTSEKAQDTPFLNPYLLNRSPQRWEMQRMFFKQLCQICRCSLINTASGEFETVLGRLRQLIR